MHRLQRLRELIEGALLTEQAYKRRKLEDLISSQSEAFLDHICKCILWGELSTDWKKTIYSILMKIHKNNNVKKQRPFGKDKIYRLLVEGPCENQREFRNYLRAVHMEFSDEYGSTRAYNIDKAYYSFKAFTKEALSLVNNPVDRADLYDLVNRYLYNAHKCK